jgi:stage II sporulation protein D
MVPELDLRREPVVRILLVRDVSAVEINGIRGFDIVDHSGHTLAGYDAGKRIHIFQRPETPDRLHVYSEVRRGGRPARAARKRLPFRETITFVPRRGGTITLNGKVYRGRIRLLRDGNHFHCLNFIPLETYLRGVVPREIGHLNRRGFEALKTQAVASRNYAIQRFAESRNRPWDMVATEYDQVYGGARDESRWADKAIEATRGEILWNGRGLAEVFYSSTCGGATTAIETVWERGPAPHLISVLDADRSGRSWCRTSKYYRWVHTWSARQLGQILRAYLPRVTMTPAGKKVGRLEDLRITEYTPEGRAKLLEVITSTGVFRVRGDRIRTALKRDLKGNALRSIMFRLEKQRDAQGNLTLITARGAGWGHGIGMCQVGAINRSKAGHKYKEILRAYYPNTQVRRLWR